MYVLVHGGQSSARFWDRLVPLLDDEVLAVNRRAAPAGLRTWPRSPWTSSTARYPSSWQDEMLARLPQPPDVVRLPVGHIAAVTHPDASAAVQRDERARGQ